jgi:transmembrane sensor
MRRWSMGTAIATGCVAIALAAAVVLSPRSRGGPSQITASTGPAELRVVTLPDSSRITLAPRTRVVVRDGYGRSHRSVAIEGRAYFDVVSANRLPFVVTASNMSVRVLGTAFDMRAYPNESGASVGVVQGKVVVRAGTHAERTLVAGHVLHVTDSVVSEVQGRDLAADASWTTGRLAFRETPLADVLKTLSQWYGMRFEVSDSGLVQQRVTTTLDYRETRDLVRALEIVLNVTATQRVTPSATVITLTPNRQARRRSNGVRERANQPFLQTEVGR